MVLEYGKDDYVVNITKYVTRKHYQSTVDKSASPREGRWNMARSLDLSELGREDLFDLMEMIVDRLPIEELLRVREIVEAKRQEKLEEAKNVALEEFRISLERIGLRLEDVLPARQGRRGRRRSRRAEGQSLPVKYRSPDGHEWSGRGKIPKWLEQLEAKGHSRDEYVATYKSQ